MYFQLEVDYYSNEANKNKYKNFQLIASTKNNLKIAEEKIVQGIVLATTTCHDLLLWLESTLLLGLVIAWKYIFQVEVSSGSYVCLSNIWVALYLYQHDIPK